jgi:hypothetical protein
MSGSKDVSGIGEFAGFRCSSASVFFPNEVAKEGCPFYLQNGNSERGDQELTREALEDAFEARWEQFEKGLAEAGVEPGKGSQPSSRLAGSLLSEFPLHEKFA